MEIQASTPVGEIAAASAAAATILEKYGIDYCAGGRRSLEDACRERGVSFADVQNEIAHTIGTVASPAADWNTASLKDLIRHIVTKHHEYLKLELPRVRQRVRAVVQDHSAKDPETLAELETVYEELWQELDLHMHKEELMLFPAVQRFEAATRAGTMLPPPPFGSIRNPIVVMEREHDSAEAALGRIRELTRGFEAPPYACSTYRTMLEGLKALEADLRVHIHLENKILFPRAIEMEER